MSIKQKKIPCNDVAWGVDPHQPSKIIFGGKNQFPLVLWKSPKCERNGDNVTGAIRHGQKVRVVKRKRVNTGNEIADFYFVRCVIEYEGAEYAQRGWIDGRFLYNLGRHGERKNER